MEIKLTEAEMISLANQVTKKIKDAFIDHSITDTIYNDFKIQAERIIKNSRPEIEVKCNSIDLLQPIIERIFRENKLLDTVVRKCIAEYFNTNEFKKVSIEMLRDKINSLENSLKYEMDED